MVDFEQGLQILSKVFGRDYQFALATAADNVPSIRFVDTYYENGCFYIVTYRSTRKMREILTNPNVALHGRTMHNFQGKATCMGHPLEPQNAAIRERLIEVFRPWYFAHNNEADEQMCYLKVEPSNGFFHHDGTGYEIDFVNRTIREFPFPFESMCTAD